MASPKPIPICRMIGIELVAKDPITTKSRRAAEVMMPPVFWTPAATAWVLSPVRSYYSLMRLSRKAA